MNNLPVILLKGLVLLPNQEVRLELNNGISKEVIKLSSMRHSNQLLVVCPKDQIEQSPEIEDLPNVGVIGKIKSKIELPTGNLSVVIVGLERVKVLEYSNYENNEQVLNAKVNSIVLPKFEPVEESAKRNKLLIVFRKYIDESPYVSNSIVNLIKDVLDLSRLTDMITSFLPFTIDQKLKYMQEINALKRAEELILDLSIEIEMLQIDLRIDESLRVELDSSQKEYILREKIKQIKKELGEENEKDNEVLDFQEKLDALNIDEKIKNKINGEIKKYEYTSPMSPEFSIIRTYLDLILNLPWNKYTTDQSNLNKIALELDKTHYGLKEVKERILEYIAIKKRNKKLKSPIICLVGPPGVGKTTLTKTIAKALNKEFYKISVGGLNDSSELVGHRRTYLGSNPGKIIQALKKCNSKNPVILIDEVDKMVKDFKGDPASALLDILDIEQNYMFVDNYIEEPFDLSQVLFVLTANDMCNIPPALLDRLEIIDVNSYSDFEKIDIAKKYLLPKILKEHLVKPSEIKISDEILSFIITHYTKEAGVRELDRKLNTIVRKIVTTSMRENTSVNKEVFRVDIIKYLNKPKYELKLLNSKIPGVVNGLAVSSYGGLVLNLESVLFSGKGNVSFTGRLGETMKESCDVAISYIKGMQNKFKVDSDLFNTKDIHLHILEGSIPKDGPSAGIAIVTSILSLVLNKPVSQKIAMTGEISLCGEVLKIGGVKEKVIGAYNSKVTKIILPKSNQTDLDEIPTKIKDKMEFIFVANYLEIYNLLFKK